MTLSESEVYNITCNRNIGDNFLKDSQINAAKQNWVDEWIDASILEKVEDDPSTYKTFIDDYIKPVWAWGVIYNNFEYISTNITEKGIIQLLTEGAATMIGRDARMDTKQEFKSTIYFLLRRLDAYAEKEIDDWDGLKLEPKMVIFRAREKFNINPF